VAAIRWDIREHVQSDGKLKITGIEICQVVGSVWWNVVQQFFGQIAVGINDTDSMSERDVLNDEIPQESRLAGPSFSDDVNVLTLINGRYAKRPRVAPNFALSDDDVWFVIHGSKTSRHSFHKGKPSCLSSLEWIDLSAGSCVWDKPAR